MSSIAISFEWSRAHNYECVPWGSGSLIRPVGKKRERTRPLEKIEKLLAFEFSELDGSPEGCIQFARAFGLILTEPRSDGSGEFLEDWRARIQNMRRTIADAGAVLDRGEMKIATLDVVLQSGGMTGSKPRLAFRPQNLWGAMRVQFAQSLAGGAAIRQCRHCSAWFEAGAGGRRSVALFCSAGCKDRSAYERRVGK